MGPANPVLLLVSAGADCLQLYRVSDNLGSLQIVAKFPLKHSDLGLRSSFAPLMTARSGACLVSASEDGAVYFFQGKACINKLEAHSVPALAVAFNHDESFLATSDTSGLVIVWKR